MEETRYQITPPAMASELTIVPTLNVLFIGLVPHACTGFVAAMWGTFRFSLIGYVGRNSLRGVSKTEVHKEKEHFFSENQRNFFASIRGESYSDDVATAGREGGLTAKMGSSTLPQLKCRIPVATA